MPITITLPVPPTVGPGLPIDLVSDFIGPLPVPHSFQVIASTTPEGTDVIIGQLQHFTQQIWQTWWLSQSGITSIVPDAVVAEGAQVHVLAKIVDDTTGQVIDSGATTATWSSTAGLGYQQFRAPTTITGGFTESDRQVLVEVQGNTRVNYNDPTPVPTTATMPLGDWQWNGALGLLNRHESILITGRGSAHRGPDPNRLQAYGVRVFFVVVPDGFGMTPGAVDVFERRMVQLVVVRRMADGSEWPSDVWDIRQSGGVFMWGPPLANRLEYQVAPGVTAELQWFALPFQ